VEGATLNLIQTCKKDDLALNIISSTERLELKKSGHHSIYPDLQKKKMLAKKQYIYNNENA
jgi:hypothetical protein